MIKRRGAGDSGWRAEALALAAVVQPALLAAASDPDKAPNGRPGLEGYLTEGFVSVDEQVNLSSTYAILFLTFV